MRGHRRTGRAVAVAVAAVMLAGVTSCADPTTTVSDRRATMATEPATSVSVTSCSPATIEGETIYPDIPEGSLPDEVAVSKLLWCSYNQYQEQMVGFTSDALPAILDEIRDTTMTRAEVSAVCSADVRIQPAVFALTTRGTYRVALPRNGCNRVTAAVRRILDAEDGRWLITEVQRR